MERYYKVVRRGRAGEYWSAVVDSIATLPYRIGEVTKPVVGPIFAFSKINDAISFAESHPVKYFFTYGTATILSGIGVKSDHVVADVLPTEHLGMASISRWWTNRRSSQITPTPVPAGTAYLDEFQPDRIERTMLWETNDAK